ncbi:protein translocase subunit SecF [Sorangium sp. So ce341]|uniref:protein translocase subunit SecF n=1 Tax=Sorangium sp. So ce341 TaxID=3133302 RepID=UPI003F63CEE9
MELIKPGRQFDFMSKRWLFMGLSGILLILSIISFIVPGPKLGTDFKGGTEVEVAFKAPVSSAEVREAVTKSGFDSPDVVSVADQSNPNRYLIRVHEVSALSEQQKAAVREHMCLAPEGGSVPEDRCPEAVRATEVKFSPGGDKISARYEVAPDLEGIKKQLEGIEGVEIRPGANNPLVVSERDHKVELYLKSKGDQLMDGLRQHLGADKVPDQALRVEWIGPKAGAQLRDAAIKSVLITIFFIMAYIAFRFDIRFAPGGILALVHDVGIALGAMVITQREITLSTVAALLTIVGYSITDTVVVYDRIRENLGKHRDMSFSAVINYSLSEMLGRTILVSTTTFLSLVMFLFYGTGVIRDFAFTLVVGIVVGTYSSIYVAAPLTEWIDRRFFGSASGKRKKVSRVRTQKRADAVV